MTTLEPPEPADDLVELLERLEAGELGDPLAVIAYLSGRDLEIPQPELVPAVRRSLLLLAAGGDPNRELGVDDRAVKALAADLHTAERRSALARGIDGIVLTARPYPRVRDAALYLAADLDLSWRLFAAGLLADELAADDD